MSNKPFELSPSGFIEFEHVAPPAAAPEASAPADDGLDADPMSINFGREKDHKPAPAERMLAGTTIDWLVALPVTARPKALCERFPHVANRLAKDWPDVSRSAASLRVLADDPRWGGVGFPAQVQGELRRVLGLVEGK